MTQKKFYGLGGETYVYVADHPTDSALVLVQKELEVKRYSYDGPETAIELGRILVRRRGELYTAPPKPNFDSDIAALRGTLDGLLKEVQKLRETKNRLLDEGAELIKLRELPENRDLVLWQTVRTAPSVWAVWRRWSGLSITEIKREDREPPLLGFLQTSYKHDVLRNTSDDRHRGEGWHIYPVGSDEYGDRWYPCQIFVTKDEAMKFAQQAYDIQSAEAVQDGPRGAYIECPEGLIPNRLLELQRAQALLTNQDRTLQQAQDDLNKKLAERAALRVQIEELSKETP